MASIDNTGLATSQFSNYSYTTTPENFITGITETSDASAVYPNPLTQTASYNNLNQLTNLSGQALTFDADGNLTSDGSRNYAWDAENRLVGITYPSQPGKQTTFAYDGLGRRTAISSTPAGGGTVTTSYVWCGMWLCQARNSSGSTVREYFTEGEFAPGSPAQSYYYGPDQIGSVRRVFASTSSAPAYSYDPYGNALQATAPLTDFGYAGMFYNADSGLYLTFYRAYDPVAARWISRDPIGVMYHQDDSTIPYHLSNWLGMTVALLGTSGRNEGHPFKRIGGTNSLVTRVNLYAYGQDEPIYQTDQNGLFPGESGGADTGESGGGNGSSFDGCGPGEAPIGQAPDGTSVDPVDWRTCLMVICIISGMNKPWVASQPSLEDIPEIVLPREKR